MGIVTSKEIDSLKDRIATIESQMGGMRFDVRDAVRSEIVQNSTVVDQSQMQYGLYTALCIDTIDIWKQNRIRFYSPLFHLPNMKIQELPWAHAISNMGGFDDCGMTWVPPAGSTVCILFENGSRSSPYYIGTTWHRSRGPDGRHTWGFNINEYYKIWEGTRRGYLVGPDDGSQVLPPWNTENYNGFDLTSGVDFSQNPEAQRLITYPHIYGFKTPEKHMIKMVDGDPKCNRKWKRFEIMSSCGNWIMLKDDHLHYAGQWAHPECGGVVKEGETSCVEDAYNQNQIDRYRSGLGQNAATASNAKKAKEVIVGDPTTIVAPRHGLTDGQLIYLRDTTSIPPVDGFYNIRVTGPDTFTIPFDSSGGKNGSGGTWLPKETVESAQKDFAAANVTDLTPEQGKKLEETSCDEKESNRKIIGGHPRTPNPKSKHYKTQIGSNPYFKHKQECRPYRGSGTPQNNSIDLPQSGIQIQSISGHSFVMDDSVEEPSGDPKWDREFDFGCNNKFVGRTYWVSATGHYIEMSDIEGRKDGEGGIRGPDNYIKIKSASGNSIQLNDHTESQPNCKECPPNIAGPSRGIEIISTSNHRIQMCDEGNEQCGPCRTNGGVPVAKAKKAFVKIRSGYGLEMSFNDDSNQQTAERQSIQIFSPMTGNAQGPHIMRFQEAPADLPGLVFLRVAGNYLCTTNINHITVVGNDDYVGNMVEYVTNLKLVYTKDAYINITETSHLFLAKDKIILGAGEDCPPPPDVDQDPGPCILPVLVLKNGGIAASDRVFASASPAASVLSIFNLKPFYKEPPQEA